MSRIGKAIWQVIKVGGRGLFGCALWTLWLALAIALVVQIYVVSTNELAVPAFVLRQFEQRLAASGIRVTFSGTIFDPSGRFLIENVRAFLPAFSEPVFTARTVYVRFNPGMLVVGRVEPREIRVSDATAAIPGMLSPSGIATDVVRDLDATIIPDGRQVVIEQLSGRIAGVTVSARGTLQLPGPRETTSPALAEFLVQNFPALCRRAIAVTEQLAAFEQPSLHVELAPSESGAAVVSITLLARQAKLQTPVLAEARNLSFVTRVLLFGEAPSSQLEFAADELSLPFATTAHGVRALVLGRLRPGGGFQFEPREFDVTAESLASAGFSAEAVAAQIFPRPLPLLEGTVIAQIAGAPLAIRAEADFGARRAELHFDGAVSPAVLDPIGRQFGVNVRPYFDFAALTCERGEVRLGPDWKFERLAAFVGLRKINAYGVTLDDGKAAIEFDGRRFYSPDASARIGVNFARGSYEHDLLTHQYRFLLNGRLRPMDISGWFREWWPNFFAQFEFPLTPPDASVDVSGFWRDGRRSAVFVSADAPRPTIRGTPLDHVRTRLFIRPGIFEGLEVSATTGGQQSARGTFYYELDAAARDWRTLDLKFDSTVDVATITQMVGPAGAKVIAPFRITSIPNLKFLGHFAGPGAPGGEHQSVDLDCRTTGEFGFHDFPLRDVSFRLQIRDDRIAVNDIEALFASGAVSGRASVWGPDAERRVGFDVTLKDARLGEAATVVQSFAARQSGQPASPPGKFVQEKAAVHFDLNAAAEGSYGDPFSYHGTGTTALRGTEIGEVPLLGSLSELLKFTALRFTEARGNFKIEGPRLVFSDVTLRGSNSAIDAHGEYALDAGALDFKAKIFPFQESGNLVKTVVGAVLSPISSAFEVILTGKLEKPEWRFEISPANFLRALNPGTTETGEKPNSTPDSAAQKPSNPPSDKPFATPPP